jgi:tetratricopeptide (TPR) repeat protein
MKNIYLDSILLIRGLSKIKKNDISLAISDFIKMSDNTSLTPRKYLYLGYCYHYLGLYGKAEGAYLKAIDFSPQTVYSYYNLAILSLNKNDFLECQRYLKICMRVDKNFRQAFDLFNSVNAGADWFMWWFRGNKKSKKVIGGFIFANLFLLMYSILLYDRNELILVILLAFLTFMLVLPSIKKIRYKDSEIEINPFLNDLDIDQFLAPLDPESLVEIKELISYQKEDSKFDDTNPNYNPMKE